MIITDPKQTMLQSLQESCSLNAYIKTIHNLDRINTATDKDYQKNFTNYYRVRRDAQWLAAFYRYLEDNKSAKDITFEQILRYLSGLEHNVKVCAKNPTGRAKTVDPSYASKMLATINPNHPIWDSQVFNFLQITVPETSDPEEKIRKCVDIYGKIEKEITDFIATESGQECIRVFDRVFPQCTGLSDYKKIDFYLWNLGKPVAVRYSCLENIGATEEKL